MGHRKSCIEPFQGAEEPSWVLDVPGSRWGRECPVGTKRFRGTAEVDTGPDTSVLLTREGLGLVSFCRAASLGPARIQGPCYSSSSSRAPHLAPRHSLAQSMVTPVGSFSPWLDPEGQGRALTPLVPNLVLCKQ